MQERNTRGQTTEQLAILEDQLSSLAEKYRSAADAFQSAAEQVRVMRETVEFAQERRKALEGPSLAEVRVWLRTMLPGGDGK